MVLEFSVDDWEYSLELLSFSVWQYSIKLQRKWNSCKCKGIPTYIPIGYGMVHTSMGLHAGIRSVVTGLHASSQAERTQYSAIIIFVFIYMSTYKSDHKSIQVRRATLGHLASLWTLRSTPRIDSVRDSVRRSNDHWTIEELKQRENLFVLLITDSK